MCSVTNSGQKPLNKTLYTRSLQLRTNGVLFRSQIRISKNVWRISDEKCYKSLNCLYGIVETDLPKLTTYISNTEYPSMCNGYWPKPLHGIQPLFRDRRNWLHIAPSVTSNPKPEYPKNVQRIVDINRQIKLFRLYGVVAAAHKRRTISISKPEYPKCVTDIGQKPLRKFQPFVRDCWNWSHKASYLRIKHGISKHV